MVAGAEDVDGIPVRWVAPPSAAGAAVWLTHLGGSTEQTEPMLARLAERDLLAVSIDPPGHGERGAQRFREALAERDPRALDRVQVTLYEGVSHLDGARDDRLYTAALEWLTLTSRA